MTVYRRARSKGALLSACSSPSLGSDKPLLITHYVNSPAIGRGEDRGVRGRSVESGEVLYHDIVTAMPVPEFGKKWSDSSIGYELQPALHAALDQALSVAIAHLNQSFR